MSVLTKEFLSASASGVPIKVTATSTAGTLIHTTPASSTGRDEIWLYGSCSGPSGCVVTIEFGDAMAPDHNIKKTVDINASNLLLEGIPLNYSGTVKVFAATANVVNVYGYVNRIT